MQCLHLLMRLAFLPAVHRTTKSSARRLLLSFFLTCNDPFFFDTNNKTINQCTIFIIHIYPSLFFSTEPNKCEMLIMNVRTKKKDTQKERTCLLSYNMNKTTASIDIW